MDRSMDVQLSVTRYISALFSPSSFYSLLSVLFPLIFILLPLSGSSCSLAAGLESLGLTDIRTLVRLMCLAAAGRAGLSTSLTAGPGHTERPRGATKASKPISCLAYLSTAVGCLASNSPSAAKLLVQLCTQVLTITLFHMTINVLSSMHCQQTELCNSSATHRINWWWWQAVLQYSEMKSLLCCLVCQQ